jgi:hypothetical protein
VTRDDELAGQHAERGLDAPAEALGGEYPHVASYDVLNSRP